MRFYTATFAAASIVGLTFAASSANAQAYGQPVGPPPGGYAQPYGDYNNYEGTNVGGPNEVVIVAPNFHARTSHLNAPPEDVSLSERISYADLDLRTRDGAHALRERIRLSAARICDQLRQVYPYALTPRESCFRETLNNSMPKANSAIDDARIAARRANEDGYYGGYDR